MKMFPILSTWHWDNGIPRELVAAVPRSIPWELVAPHEARAIRNHAGQTLKRLAERGGLSPLELYCVINDKPLLPLLEHGNHEAEAAEWLICLVRP